MPTIKSLVLHLSITAISVMLPVATAFADGLEVSLSAERFTNKWPLGDPDPHNISPGEIMLVTVTFEHTGGYHKYYLRSSDYFEIDGLYVNGYKATSSDDHYVACVKRRSDTEWWYTAGVLFGDLGLWSLGTLERKGDRCTIVFLARLYSNCRSGPIALQMKVRAVDITDMDAGFQDYASNGVAMVVVGSTSSPNQQPDAKPAAQFGGGETADHLLRWLAEQYSAHLLPPGVFGDGVRSSIQGDFNGDGCEDVATLAWQNTCPHLILIAAVSTDKGYSRYWLRGRDYGSVEELSVVCVNPVDNSTYYNEEGLGDAGYDIDRDDIFFSSQAGEGECFSWQWSPSMPPATARFCFIDLDSFTRYFWNGKHFVALEVNSWE
ncbi:MAG: hypothetical protein ABIL25_03880 [candidate division WOR-3 bacterium]